MSLHAPNEPRHDGGRWETIRYALDSNPRTLRFCLIWFVVIVSPVVTTVITLLLRHMLLRGRESNGYSAGITPAVPVSIEAPEGWGPTCALIGQLRRLGYHVEEGGACSAGPCS